MPELRQNAATKEWVIIATERAKRPDHFSKRESKETSPGPEFDPSCPFCPGNEHEGSGEVYRVGDEKSWRVRVVNNKFPALSPKGEPFRRSDNMNRSVNGVGICQVLIESPVHNTTTALLSGQQMIEVLETAQLQYQRASADRRIEHVVLFKNHGGAAGTSIEHPHWQMIAMPLVPAQVRDRVTEALRYYDDNGECVYCRMLASEREAQVRIVVETELFVAFCPFAALSPFHTWILPRHHRASFGDTSHDELVDLASNLRQVLGKLHHGLGNPDYNLVFRCAPVGHSKVQYFHWYASLCPRLTKAAGFELGSGMFVNTTIPEESAAFLRDVKIDDQAG